jgi:hypothetical protein
MIRQIIVAIVLTIICINSSLELYERYQTANCTTDSECEGVE